MPRPSARVLSRALVTLVLLVAVGAGSADARRLLQDPLITPPADSAVICPVIESSIKSTTDQLKALDDSIKNIEATGLTGIPATKAIVDTLRPVVNSLQQLSPKFRPGVTNPLLYEMSNVRCGATLAEAYKVYVAQFNTTIIFLAERVEVKEFLKNGQTGGLRALLDNLEAFSSIVARQFTTTLPDVDVSAGERVAHDASCIARASVARQQCRYINSGCIVYTNTNCLKSISVQLPEALSVLRE